ncbi:MAG: NADH-quinone oxidoreductase subunit J [Acidimicrobiales bacterium]
MHGLLLAATVPDAITFAVAAVISVVGALGVVLSRHPVHSALMLVMTMFGVAVLFVEENAQFLAAAQVIVYAGAIVVLFLFVIMLLGIDRTESIAAEPLKGQRPVAVLLGLLVLAEVILLARGRWPTGAHSTAGNLNPPGTPNVNVLGKSIFTTFLLPFEVTSALLVIAVIGAVVLARRPHPLSTDPGVASGLDSGPDDAPDFTGRDVFADASLGDPASEDEPRPLVVGVPEAGVSPLSGSTHDQQQEGEE